MVLSTNYTTMYESCTSVLELADLMIENQMELHDDMYTHLIETKFQKELLTEASVGEIFKKISDFVVKWASNFIAAVTKFVRSFSMNIKILAGKIRKAQRDPEPNPFENITMNVPDIRDVSNVLSTFKIIDGNTIQDLVFNKSEYVADHINDYIHRRMENITSHYKYFYNSAELINRQFPMVPLNEDFMDLSQCEKMCRLLGGINNEIEDMVNVAKDTSSTVRRELESQRKHIDKNSNGIVKDKYTEMMRLISDLEIAISKILTFNTRVLEHRLKITKTAMDVTSLVTSIWMGEYNPK